MDEQRGAITSAGVEVGGRRGGVDDGDTSAACFFGATEECL